MTVSIFALIVIPIGAQDTHGGAPQLTPWDTSPPPGVTPSVTVTTTAFMSFTPNPIGEGQTLLVNLWLEPPTHYARYRSGYTVTFEKPDGSVDTVGPLNSYQGDTTAWISYLCDQAGEWTIQFTADANYYPAGWYYNGIYYANASDVPPGPYPMFSGPVQLDDAYYLGDSTPEQTLIVQEDQVLSWPPRALPTDYWTRPIYITNREWWEIAGDYPFTGMGGGPMWPPNTNVYANNYQYTPYVTGPDSSHIVWRRQGALGGIVGGAYGYRSLGPGEGGYAGTPDIIFQGRCYQTTTKSTVGVSNGEPTAVWQCYDLRTGEIYWEQPAIVTGVGWFGPTYGSPTIVSYDEAEPAVPGAAQTGLGTGYYSLLNLGSRMIKYDPYTGGIKANVTAMSGTYYREPYVLSVQNIGNFTNPNYRLINWTTTGTSNDFSTRVLNNISWPWSNLGTRQDFESMIAVSCSSITDPGMGTSHGTSLAGADLLTGEWLWNTTTTDITFSTSTAVADNGKFTVRMLGGWWDAWNLEDGTVAWKSDELDYPWGDFGAYTISSYGGMFFDQSYHGLYAINWTNGDVTFVHKCRNHRRQDILR
jgi:hypothetical protein